jgi:hypothetical protein
LNNPTEIKERALLRATHGVNRSEQEQRTRVK